MKKNQILALLLLLFSVSNIMARGNYEYETKHDIGISYGALSTSQFSDIFENLTLVTATFGGVRLENEKSFGPLAVEYFYHFKPWFSVGAIGVYTQSVNDMYVGDNQFIGEYKNCYYTIMPGAKFDWLRTQYFGMYSKVALGVTFRSNSTKDSDVEVDEKDEVNSVQFNLQASLVGLEAGTPRIRAFTEFGFGEQGLFNFGVRAKF